MTFIEALRAYTRAVVDRNDTEVIEQAITDLDAAAAALLSPAPAPAPAPAEAPVDPASTI